MAENCWLATLFQSTELHIDQLHNRSDAYLDVSPKLSLFGNPSWARVCLSASWELLHQVTPVELPNTCKLRSLTKWISSFIFHRCLFCLWLANKSDTHKLLVKENWILQLKMNSYSPDAFETKDSYAKFCIMHSPQNVNWRSQMLQLSGCHLWG